MSEKPTYEELEQRVLELEKANSKRKQVEHTLRESESLLSSIFRAAPTGIGVVSNRILLAVNDRVCDMIGYSREEMIGQSARMLYPSDAHFEYVGTEKYRQILQCGTGTVETLWQCKDGRIIDILMSSAPINPMDLAAGVTFTALDITERKKAERALRESEERFRKLFQKHSAVKLIIDSDTGYIIDANDAASSFYGWSIDEIRQMRIQQINTLPHEAVKANMEKTLSSEFARYEFRHRRADGSIRDVEVFSNKIDMAGKSFLYSIVHDISERMQAEESLRENEALQRILLDNLPVGVIIVDPVTRIIERVNDYVAALFGAPVDYIIGQRCHSLLCPANEGACPVCDLDINVDNSEREMLRKDGSILHILKTVKRFQLRGQEKLLECFLDLSDRKQAEQERSLNAQRTQALLQMNQMTEATLQEVTDFALEEAIRLTRSTIGYLAFLNDDESALTMHAWSKSAMAECAIADKPIIYPVETTGLWGEAVRQRRPVITNDYTAFGQMKKGYPEGHVTVRRHMNTPVFVDSRIVLVAGVGNKAEEYNQDDVQQLKLLMEGMWRLIERKRAESALRENEEKFRLTFSSSPDAVVISHLDDGLIVDVNEGFTRMTGFSREDFIGKKYMEIDLWHDLSDRQKLFHGLQEKGFYENLEGQFRRKDGRLSIGLMSARVISLKGVSHVISITRDITESKLMEAKLQQAQKFEAIGTLAGGVAHDFNNLLMGIQGRASLIAWDLDASHPLQEHIHAIEAHISSATSLTQQLLGFARGGKYEVNPVDMNELVHGSSAMFGRTKKEIRIHTKCQASPLVVEADRGQIEQVLLNMYINAWQAMPPDGGELYLETKIVTLDEVNCRPHHVEPGRYVKVSITDTGAGMDEATRLRIFDPFFTTKEMGRGTGLGLASAYGIIKNHGGMITVYSEVGHGTTFNIYLPVSDKESHRKISLEGGLIKGSATILLIDDEELIIDVGQAMLERLGYRVVVCREGLEGVKVINEMGDEIDLVILDMIMPGMDGGTTFDRIREIQPDMPVILSSGYAINGHADKIMRRGCNGFIQKPYNFSELSQKIGKVLDDAKRSSSQ